MSFIGVKNVTGVSRISGKRMEIKVAEINAPLNLMKRKLSETQFKNGNALTLLSLASTGNSSTDRHVYGHLMTDLPSDHTSR